MGSESYRAMFPHVRCFVSVYFVYFRKAIYRCCSLKDIMIQCNTEDSE